MGDQTVAMPLPIQTSMPSVGFEPTILVFERAKTLHSSDRADTVTGCSKIRNLKRELILHDFHGHLKHPFRYDAHNNLLQII
jgi:hypothetical protein